MQIYCLKCKTQRECSNIEYTTSKNNRALVKGTCKTCGKKCSKFLKSENMKLPKHLQKNKKPRKQKIAPAEAAI